MNSTRVVWTIFLLPLFFFLAARDRAQAYTFTVLYTFQGGTNGAGPSGHLVRDNSGNLYGTTGNGGLLCRRSTSGCGTAYKLAPDGTKTVLHRFGKRKTYDGSYPASGLVEDKSGNFFGTTEYGGTKNRGTVYMLAPDGTETVLYSFLGTNGYSPDGLAQDSAGNLYGTSTYGGLGAGLVFELAPDGTETTFYAFQGGNDGANPAAPLIKDKAGNFYGTTFFGGGGTVCDWRPPSGCGTVFKLTPDGAESVLYAFSGGSDGANPQTRVAMDSAGNLYGTTYDGGAYGYGVVFKLTPARVETVLYSFKGGNDGWLPGAVGFPNGSHNLFGTTSLGGGVGCGGNGCGIVFSLTPDGIETILHVFTGGSDGARPESTLIADKSGNLYGSAALGGGTGCSEGCGTVFKLTP